MAYEVLHHIHATFPQKLHAIERINHRLVLGLLQQPIKGNERPRSADASTAMYHHQLTFAEAWGHELSTFQMESNE